MKITVSRTVPAGGKALPVPDVAIFRDDELRYVPKTDCDHHIKDGWKVVASTPTKVVHS